MTYKDEGGVSGDLLTLEGLSDGLSERMVHSLSLARTSVLFMIFSENRFLLFGAML